MKTKLFFLLAVVAIALIPTSLFAQSATESASGSATILVPITLTKNVDLNFGSMTPGANGGTCILSTANSRSKTGDVTLLTTVATSANAAFTVGGNNNAAYTITLPASLSVSNGTENMTIDAFVARAASNGTGFDSTAGTLSGTGADTFTVGGTLHVDPNQASGLYTANFSVTVTYN